MKFRRIRIIAQREWRDLLRDRIRLLACFLVPAVLMMIFGLGLNLDFEHIPFVVLDEDNTPASHDYVDHFTYSRYFSNQGNVHSARAAEDLFSRQAIRFFLEIPPHFARDLATGRSPELAFSVDGSMPFRGDSVRGYIAAMNAGINQDNYSNKLLLNKNTGLPATVEVRFWYNQALKSRASFVPGLIAVNLITISAILAALAVVRERELGQIINFYTTPVTKFEYLCGMQLPYLVLNIINALLLALMAVVVFSVPLKGSFLAFFAGAILYVIAATNIGLVIATFTRTQVSALFITFIVTMIPGFLNSGLVVPISSMSETAQFLAHCYPIAYFLDICINTFTKGLDFNSQLPNLLKLALIGITLFLASIILLKKQER